MSKHKAAQYLKRGGLNATMGVGSRRSSIIGIFGVHAK